MEFIKKLLPTDLNKRRWFSVAVTVLMAGLLTVWGIYGIGEYGVALFILTPLLIGLASAMLFAYNKTVKYKESRNTAFLTLTVFSLGLLVFAKV